MKLLKKHHLTLILFVLTSFAHAQIHFSSVQEIWKYADEHNIQIKTAQTNEKIAATNIKQTYGSMLPTVSLNGSFTDNIQLQSTLIPANLFNPSALPNTYVEANFGRRYNYNAGVIAELDIVNTQDWFAVKAAKLQTEIARIAIAKTKKDLYEQLANIYFTCILLNKAEELSKDNLKTISEIYTLSLNKFNDGLISEITLNSARINKEKAAKNLDIAQQNKTLQINTLQALLNSSESITLSEDLQQEIPATNKAFAPDPNVALSSLEFFSSKNDLQSKKSVFAPTLSAVYQYNSLTAGDHFVNFENSNTIPQQYWGLRLSLPIFVGNTRNYQVQKAKLTYDNKKEQYESAVLQNNINNMNLLVANNNALQAFKRSQSILNLYQSNDKHASQKLTEGFIALDQRLEFYADMITSQNEYLQSMSDYFIQEYRLQISQTNLIQ
jgi:outer membrane protein TolC